MIEFNNFKRVFDLSAEAMKARREFAALLAQNIEKALINRGFPAANLSFSDLDATDAELLDPLSVDYGAREGVIGFRAIYMGRGDSPLDNRVFGVEVTLPFKQGRAQVTVGKDAAYPALMSDPPSSDLVNQAAGWISSAWVAQFEKCARC